MHGVVVLYAGPPHVLHETCRNHLFPYGLLCVHFVSSCKISNCLSAAGFCCLGGVGTVVDAAGLTRGRYRLQFVRVSLRSLSLEEQIVGVATMY
jgi:hypothetical protein